MREKAFVVLKSWDALPNNTNGMYLALGEGQRYLRYPVYLKFYEDSFCYKKYKDDTALVFESGKEIAGAGERINFEFFHEEFSLAESLAKKYFSTNNHGALKFGSDSEDLKLHVNYLDIKRRTKLQ